MDVNNLVGQSKLFYEDCIVLGNSKVLKFHRAGNRINTDEPMTIDEPELVSLGYLFSQNVGAISYAGGEAAEHGSYGFSRKQVTS